MGYDVSGVSPLTQMLERPRSKALILRRQIGDVNRIQQGRQYVCHRVTLAHSMQHFAIYA